MPPENKNEYITVRGRGEARFEEKRSVFIGYCNHTENEEEALAFIREIKEKHKDATHNVFGYIMRGGILCRYSDDGEPQGTAGKPVLDVLQRSGVDDVCVVVTRYFGGTLLGTGGLVHAYGLAARLALDAAGVARFESYRELEVDCSYSDYQRISFELERLGAIVDGVEYADRVTVRFAVREPLADEISRTVSEITAGKSQISERGTRYDAK